MKQSRAQQRASAVAPWILAVPCLIALGAGCFHPSAEPAPDAGSTHGLPDAGPPTTCTIGGTELPPGTANPDNSCQTCQPQRSSRDWSSISDGQFCANATALCIGGTCTNGCFIDATYVPAGALNPANGCQQCSPATTNLHGWTTLADGSSCLSGLCSTGRCQLSCAIGGVRYPDRSEDPADPARCCSARADPTGWANSLQPGAVLQVGRGPSSLAVGDFNGDGLDDLAVTNQVDATISILLNSEGSLVVSDTLRAGASPNAIVALDYDGDGKLDLAVLNSGDATIGLYHGKSAGTFGGQEIFSVSGAPVALVAGDFDGDGRPDLISLDPVANQVSFFQNTGHGFSPALTSAAGLSSAGPPGPLPEPPFDLPPTMVAGDLRGTGVLDLALVDGVRLTVLLGDGSGRFATPTHYAAGPQPVDVAIGDLDGDGTLDLVVANYGGDHDVPPRPGDNTIGVFVGKGDGTLEGQVDYPSPLTAAWVRLVDLNGDGKAEIIVTFFTGIGSELSVLWHLPGGAVTPPTNVPLPYGTPRGRTLPIHLRNPVTADLVSANPSLSSIRPEMGNAVSTALNGCP